MRFALVLSEEAKQSIRDQRRWYRTEIPEGGHELARRWSRELDHALETLCANPERHGLAQENGEWHPEIQLRRMLFRPWKSGVGWRVLFSIDEACMQVTVLQVRHERRPWLPAEG